MTIEEQKRYLFNRLELESLRFSEQNKEEILAFEQATSGSNISNYLKNEAWQDDEAGDTKVYLVRDKVENVIVSFFALNCGILYSDLEGVSLNEEEKEPFERLVKAYQMNYRRNLSVTQQEQADKEQTVVLKLVEYYKNELKFNYVTKYKVLKPRFERTCFTLVQEVKKLEENQRSIWISHSLEDNEDKNNMNG